MCVFRVNASSQEDGWFIRQPISVLSDLLLPTSFLWVVTLSTRCFLLDIHSSGTQTLIGEVSNTANLWMPSPPLRLLVESILSEHLILIDTLIKRSQVCLCASFRSPWSYWWPTMLHLLSHSRFIISSFIGERVLQGQGRKWCLDLVMGVRRLLLVERRRWVGVWRWRGSVKVVGLVCDQKNLELDPELYWKPAWSLGGWVSSLAGECLGGKVVKDAERCNLQNMLQLFCF